MNKFLKTKPTKVTQEETENVNRSTSTETELVTKRRTTEKAQLAS